MKNKTILLLTTMLLAITVFGCGRRDSNPEPVAFNLSITTNSASGAQVATVQVSENKSIQFLLNEDRISVQDNDTTYIYPRGEDVVEAVTVVEPAEGGEEPAEGGEEPAEGGEEPAEGGEEPAEGGEEPAEGGEEPAEDEQEPKHYVLVQSGDGSTYHVYEVREEVLTALVELLDDPDPNNNFIDSLDSLESIAVHETVAPNEGAEGNEGEQ